MATILIYEEIVMIGNKCYTRELLQTNLKEVRHWLLFKRYQCSYELLYTRCNPQTIAQKINCWS